MAALSRGCKQRMRGTLSGDNHHQPVDGHVEVENLHPYKALIAKASLVSSEVLRYLSRETGNRNY